MTSATSDRAHLIAGSFPPGASAGHDHDYAQLRLLGPSVLTRGLPSSFVGEDTTLLKNASPLGLGA